MPEPAALTLTTPCTVNQLVEFVNHQVVADFGSTEAAEAGTVTSTSSTIVVSS